MPCQKTNMAGKIIQPFCYNRCFWFKLHKKVSIIKKSLKLVLNSFPMAVLFGDFNAKNIYSHAF